MKIDADTITNRNAGSIVEVVAAAIRAGDCTIDFSGVRRCDTAAVACVIAWLRLSQAGGHRLALVATPRDLLSLAKLCGVEALIASASQAN
jgi:phospholipid transport system transporter-binding protein